jgi:hypothetical protein
MWKKMEEKKNKVKKKIKNVQIKDVIEVKEDKEIMVYF